MRNAVEIARVLTRISTLAINCGSEHARGIPRLENRETWGTRHFQGPYLLQNSRISGISLLPSWSCHSWEYSQSAGLGSRSGHVQQY
jgi:cytochrome c5